MGISRNFRVFQTVVVCHRLARNGIALGKDKTDKHFIIVVRKGKNNNACGGDISPQK
jgi:hypothetical protein